MLFFLLRKWKRKRLARRPVPAQWTVHLEKHVPFFKKYGPADQERFLNLLKVFFWEKRWEGGAGIDVTEEMKVVISASAARLVMGLDLSYYDRLSTLIVYPYDYRHPEMGGAILGEASPLGIVVLSWPAVLSGLKNPRDGHDTAAHEFAHVLDYGDGDFDGTPPLHQYGQYQPWVRVMTKNFEALQMHKRRISRVLRDYGATNEAEFFAVATEAYFERPQALKKRAPEVYAELEKFYRPNTASDDPDGDR